MSILITSIESLHERAVAPRRVRVLARHLLEMLPAGCDSVLDVGCGDGAISRLVAAAGPHLSVAGIEVRPRPGAGIPVTRFDGRTLPLPDASRDAVLLVDVLHHAEDPAALLREAARVARRAVVIKDHRRESRIDGLTLRFMDHVGNRRFGVPVRGCYWSEREWEAVVADVGLRAEARRERLGLYPRPWRGLFERELHFVGRFVPARGVAA